MQSNNTSFPADWLTDSITETNRDLDVAIIGEGFFQCIDYNTGETLYSRQGNFSVNANGNLVLGSSWVGRQLEPAITIPVGTEKIQIDEAGMVWATLDTKVHRCQHIGWITLATFDNPNGLESIGENLYRETEASGPAMVNYPCNGETGILKAHYLEKMDVVVTEQN
jgi:flagellar basal-body rod protein FlgG